jgi:hypothetical protein
MALLFLPHHPPPGFGEPGQTLVWPDVPGYVYCATDGVITREAVDPASLLSSVDEDQIARTIDASLLQLDCLKGQLLSLALPGNRELATMPRSEHRTGQRFVIPEASVVTVVFNTSKRVAGIDRGYPDTSTYLDIGGLAGTAIVDYSTTSAAADGITLRHSGDFNYFVGGNGTVPGPLDRPTENKLVQTVTVDWSSDTPVHLVVAGFSSKPLNRFVSGGVLTFITRDHLYNVVIDFPPGVFGDAVGAPRSCAVATIRPYRGSLVVDVSVPGDVLGYDSAPFTKTKALNQAALAAPLPPLATAPLATAQRLEPIPEVAAIEHRVDCETVLMLETTDEAGYRERMDRIDAQGRPVHLLLVNEALIPIAGSPKIEDVEAAVQAVLGQGLGPIVTATGQQLSQKLLKKMLSARRLLKLQVSGGAAVPAAPATPPPPPGGREAVIVWTGVDKDTLRDHVDDLLAAAGRRVAELHAFSGVSTERGRAGGTVHLPVVLCGAAGLKGGSVLKASTPWCGYEPSDAPAWFSGRNLVIAGPMSPAAAACAGPDRIGGVFLVTTDNLAAWRVMAAPSSVLLRLCEDGTTAEWIDGVQSLLPGLHVQGDRLPVRTLVRWALGQVGWDCPVNRVTVTPTGLLACGSTSVFELPQGIGDARALAECFLASDVVPVDPPSLRTAGSPNCHEVEAMLDTAHTMALQAAAVRLADHSEDPPSPACLLDQATKQAGELDARAASVLLGMRLAALAHRFCAAEWQTLRYQMAWFGGPEAKQYAINELSGQRFVGATAEFIDAPTPANLQDIVRARRRRTVGRPAKMLVLMFDPVDVRTTAQLEIQREHAHRKNASQAAKGLRIGANVAAVQQWDVGDLADHIDALCGDLGRCAFFNLDPVELAAGRLVGVIPLRPMIGTGEVAALLEIPAARPQSISAMLPVLSGHALGTDHSGDALAGLCLCLPIPDEAARAETPWTDFQVRSVAPEGDAFLRVALLRGMETMIPDLGERRKALRRLFEYSARQTSAAAVQDPGEYTTQVARGMLIRLLCLWASGQTPLSWTFQLAQPNGMDHLPKDGEWPDVALLMELWAGTGWADDRLRSNLAGLAGKVVQRSIQPFLTALQKQKAKRPVNAPHPNDTVLLSGIVTEHMCDVCHIARPMSRTQRRRSCRRGRQRRCIECCQALDTLTRHPQYKAWLAGTLGAPAEVQALVETTELAESPDKPLPTRQLIASCLNDDTVFWDMCRFLRPDPMEAVRLFALDLYAEPDATLVRKTQLARRRFVV